MPETRKPAAAMIPRGLGGVGDPAEQQRRANAALAPALGAKRLWFRGDDPIFAVANTAKGSPKPADIERDLALTLLFPTGHHRHPDERFDWVFAERGPDGIYRPTDEPADGYSDQPARVKYGFLRPDVADDDAPPAPVVEEVTLLPQPAA